MKMAKSSIVCVVILLKSLLLLASCNGDCQSALQAVTSSISVNNNSTTTADTVVHQSPVKNGEENIDEIIIALLLILRFKITIDLYLKS